MLTIPNSADSFIVDELRSRLAQGITVRIVFGGDSMLPLINGSKDKIELSPLDGPVRKGDVYLFVYQGRCVIHRLIAVEDDCLVFRGDNCMGHERVHSDAVLARLSAVVKPDGRIMDCNSAEWHRLSRRVTLRRSTINLLRRSFCSRQRRWERWVYFALLLILMWAPMGVLGIPLDNFVLGIRADHLLHASVYVPCVFFMMDFFVFSKRRSLYSWLAALLLCLTTEIVQYWLPYRGFDINDLIANTFGVTVGLVLLVVIRRKKSQNR